jgi:4-hydroxy-2-oxoheptanedioate aldolase
MPSFKAKLQETDRRLTCHFCTIPSAIVTQAIAAEGADGVIIDQEHGAIDLASLHAMIAATAGTDCAPLVRVVEATDANVKRALDLGAEGICFPMLRTPGDVRKAVATLRYPPNGTRGFGPFIAQSRWQTSVQNYRAKIEPHLVCILLIETLEAVENIEEICEIEGIDMIIPAQFDLSTAMGCPGEFDNPDLMGAVSRICEAATAKGIPLGQVALSEEQAKKYLASGYRMIAGFDAAWLRAKAAEAQGWLNP